MSDLDPNLPFLLPFSEMDPWHADIAFKGKERERDFTRSPEPTMSDEET